MLIVLLLSAPVVVILSANDNGAAEISMTGKNPTTVNSWHILLSMIPPSPLASLAAFDYPKPPLKRIKKLPEAYNLIKIISVKIHTKLSAYQPRKLV